MTEDQLLSIRNTVLQNTHNKQKANICTSSTLFHFTCSCDSFILTHTRTRPAGQHHVRYLSPGLQRSVQRVYRVLSDSGVQRLQCGAAVERALRVGKRVCRVSLEADGLNDGQVCEVSVLQQSAAQRG